MCAAPHEWCVRNIQHAYVCCLGVSSVCVASEWHSPLCHSIVWLRQMLELHALIHLYHAILVSIFNTHGGESYICLQANFFGSCCIPLWPWFTSHSLVRAPCHCAQIRFWFHVGPFHHTFPAKCMVKCVCAVEQSRNGCPPHHASMSPITCGQACTCYYRHDMMCCHKFCSALLHETWCRQTSSDT